MSNATSSSLGNNEDNHAELQPFPSVSKKPLCTSCHISFQDGQDQRKHMKEPWHVHNVKRRTASQPSISLNAFNLRVEQQKDTRNAPASSRNSSSSDFGDSVLGESGEKSISPFQCLFCSKGFASDDAGFAMNIKHMYTVHEMLIPDPELVIDMQSFVGYLATEVRLWHECLYCGAIKPSTQSIQSHMRDKRHCRLNLDREPELVDFWENPEWVDAKEKSERQQASSIDLLAPDVRLPSGRVVSPKNAPSPKKELSRKRQLATSTTRMLTLGSEDPNMLSRTAGPQRAPGLDLTRRGEMSMLGIPVHQQQTLVLAAKKAQRNEAVACRAREWLHAKAANSQKFDQVDNQRKWGKQNHKLLPR